MADLKLIALFLFLSTLHGYALGTSGTSDPPPGAAGQDWLLAGLVNVAHNKTAVQISQQGYAVASRAVDGNRRTSAGYCSETGKHMQPWLRVDLGKHYKVKGLTITNRGDMEWKRLRNLSVYVDNRLHGRDNHETEDKVEGPPGIHKCIANKNDIGRGETKTYFCDDSFIGRYVTIGIEADNLDQGQLSVCEMEVWAEPDPIECIDGPWECKYAQERPWAVCGDCYHFITCVNADRHTDNTCPNTPKDLYFDVDRLYCVQKDYANNPCKKNLPGKGNSVSMDED